MSINGLRSGTDGVFAPYNPAPACEHDIGFRIEMVVCVYDKPGKFPAAFRSLGRFAF